MHHSTKGKKFSKKQISIFGCFQKFGTLLFTDPLTVQTHDRSGIIRNGERTDGQTYMTINAFKRFWSRMLLVIFQ